MKDITLLAAAAIIATGLYFSGAGAKYPYKISKVGRSGIVTTDNKTGESVFTTLSDMRKEVEVIEETEVVIDIEWVKQQESDKAEALLEYNSFISLYNMQQIKEFRDMNIIQQAKIHALAQTVENFGVGNGNDNIKRKLQELRSREDKKGS